jgi:tRNA threonylcarbamoyladenosine biosynthesis protein TsaE
LPPQSPHSWVFSSDGPARTAAIAAAVAAHLRPGDVVELTGELGTGKTTFVRAAANALGVRGQVRSPSYTIGTAYTSDRGRVSHLDLYRATGMTEEEWGDLEPYFDDAVVFVEWPEAGRARLPEPTWTVALRHQGGDARLISLGCKDASALDAVARTLA